MLPVHPEYRSMSALWAHYRATLISGLDYIEHYVVKFSKRESDDDFADRKAITPLPAFAKVAMIEIKNAIYQRMPDITRVGGPTSYQKAVLANDFGVDLYNRTMNNFVGNCILLELCAMGKVGIFIDKPPLPENANAAVVRNYRPYLYTFCAEDILNWEFDNSNQLVQLLVRKFGYSLDEQTMLPSKQTTEYIHFRRLAEGVSVTRYNTDDEIIGEELLALTTIPLVVVELTQSLLTDIFTYQRAMVNLASTDINYGIKSNFPFLTEQFLPYTAFLNNNAGEGAEDSDGNITDEGAGEAKVGSLHGRRYPKGTERPQFINPSSEPLKASMLKQEDMKLDIRQIMNLSLTNIEPRRSSAESKAADQFGKEEGLSAIGIELERAEREVARIWAEYEGSRNYATIHYPRNYTVVSEEERQARADKILTTMSKIPSITFQKEATKTVVSLLIGNKVSATQLNAINKEIDDAQIIVTDPEILNQDHEAGFVSTATASQIRGYADGEVEQAKKDRAERAAAVALAQSKAGARGVSELSGDPKQDAEGEKEQSRLERDKTKDPQ